MNCKNCGAPLKDGAKFCAGCGQTINEPAQTPACSSGGYSQPAAVNPFQMNQQPTPPNQQGYGGYVQNQPTPQRSQMYGGYGHQQVGYGAGYPYERSTASGIKTIFILFMAAAIILLSFGMLYFPFVKSADDDYHYSVTNGTVLDNFINTVEYNDGDLIETLKEMFEDEDDLLVNIGFIASVVLPGITILFCVIGLICGLAGSHSSAAALMGVGSIITAGGYLLVFLEGLSGASESEDSILKCSASPVQLIMIFVSVAMFILACVSAGKLRRMAD